MEQTKKTNTIAYIGRFQPFHNAHFETVKEALRRADQLVIVVGSANQPRDEDNPFTVAERIGMITASILDWNPDALKRVDFVSVENTLYNDLQWVSSVSKKVEDVAIGNISLIGHSKDETSFYLQMFPHWGSPIEMPEVEALSATDVRKLYFKEHNNLNFVQGVVPHKVLDFLKTFSNTSDFQYIVKEQEYIENYKAKFEHLPYPPTFMTGDAVVFKAGHVVMVKRRAAPGKGLMALPGGFLNANNDKTILDAAVRELFEETKIKVPEKIIRASIREEKIFSHINRSRRGRVITVAQFIVLDDASNPGLPKLKGSDDAEKAVWVPIHKLDRSNCFEDHYDIISWFKGRYQS